MQFLIESRKRVILCRFFYCFSTLYLFRILTPLWFRWIRQRRIWQTWIWIQVSWYVRYRIILVVAWRMIAFRCHYFLWWVMGLWWRVTCCPMGKNCSRSGYQRWQHIFYCTNIFLIIDLSNACQILWVGLVRVGVIWINGNWVGILAIPNYIIFVPNLFNFKIIFAPRMFENVFANRVLNSPCIMPSQVPVDEIQHPP